MTDRGVSTTLNYVLTLAISTLLVGGLLVAGSTYVDHQRETVIDSQLQVIGQRLADDIATADRLVQASDGTTDVRITTSLPTTVAGSTYAIDVQTDSGDTTLRLRAQQLDRTVTVAVANKTVIEPGTVNNPDIAIVYDSTTSADIEVQNA